MFAFLDDVHIIAKQNIIKNSLAELPAILKDYGLALNMSKTTTFSPGLDLTDPARSWPACKIPQRNEGVKVLGTPIGSPDWVLEYLIREVEVLQPLLNVTLRLPAQHAMLLLRHCLVAQINAKLRMLPQI